MLPGPIVAALAVGVAIALLLVRGAPAIARHTWGRVVLLAGLLVMPLLISAANLHAGVTESSQTRFCLSCHEMQRHGMSLFADDRRALAAVHYQNRLIDRDQTCYSCHKDYAMFGDVKAKLNGLRHVWAHYSGRIPEKLALYEPYKSSNCLHCHDDARRFVEAPAHKPVVASLYAGTTSCLSCHTVAHDMKKVEANQLWQAQ
jgi:cytochrome c-type protein NapC